MGPLFLHQLPDVQQLFEVVGQEKRETTGVNLNVKNLE